MDYKKEDTNPDIELLLEDAPAKEKPAENVQEPVKAETEVEATPPRPTLDLSAIDPNKPVVSDRRRHSRVEMRGSMHLHTGNFQNVLGNTADISASGVSVRIENRFQFQPGTVMTIEFRPPSGLNGFLAQVQVVRSVNTMDGKILLGLRIVKCTKLMEQKLIEFIKKAG